MQAAEMQFGDETLVITLGENVEITSMNGDTYNAEDLTVDLVIGFTTDDNDQVVKIQVMDMEIVPEAASEAMPGTADEE